MADQCCCGKHKPLTERFISNGTLHEPLGEAGAFCGSLQAHELHDLRAKLAEREAEVKVLRGFFEHMALDVWELTDIDGGDFQDRAVEQGLLVTVPADDQFKAEYDCDEMYTWSWSPLALTPEENNDG